MSVKCWDRTSRQKCGAPGTRHTTFFREHAASRSTWRVYAACAGRCDRSRWRSVVRASEQPVSERTLNRPTKTQAQRSHTHTHTVALLRWSRSTNSQLNQRSRVSSVTQRPRRARLRRSRIRCNSEFLMTNIMQAKARKIVPLHANIRVDDDGTVPVNTARKRVNSTWQCWSGEANKSFLCQLHIEDSYQSISRGCMCAMTHMQWRWGAYPT